MTGSPFSFLQSKIKGRSWNVNIAIDSILRRCKTTRDDSSSGSSTGAPSPTTSSFSKKSIFGKMSPRNLWKCRRESRDDFGNRWSKIYLPGYSRSATPLPDIYPSATHTNGGGGGEEYNEPENELNFVNTITGLGYLEMMYEDEMLAARTHTNSPYIHTTEHPAKPRFSWLSWGSSLHLTLSRPPTRGMNKSS